MLLESLPGFHSDYQDFGQFVANRHSAVVKCDPHLTGHSGKNIADSSQYAEGVATPNVQNRTLTKLRLALLPDRRPIGNFDRGLIAVLTS